MITSRDWSQEMYRTALTNGGNKSLLFSQKRIEKKMNIEPADTFTL